MLLQQEHVLVSGATDGCLQIRINSLDPIKQPQKTLDLQMYDFYSNAIKCLAVHNGIVFTGGENGVFFRVDCSETGLPREIKPQSTITSFISCFFISIRLDVFKIPLRCVNMSELDFSSMMGSWSKLELAKLVEKNQRPHLHIGDYNILERVKNYLTFFFNFFSI